MRFVSVSLVSAVLALAACGGDDERIPPLIDAAPVDAAVIDAPLPIDAPAIDALPIDAAVPIDAATPIDAAPDA